MSAAAESASLNNTRLGAEVAALARVPSISKWSPEPPERICNGAVGVAVPIPTFPPLNKAE